MACLSKEFKCKKKENAMVKLSTSNLLWYIYQRNCEVGYPTVISMSQFCAEFPEATRKDIINELDNLINGMHFIHRRFLCVYDLTEEGLEEALHLRKFVVNPCKQVWWVRVLQIIVRRFYSLKKVTALIFIVSLLSLTLSAEVTNEASVSISGNVNGHIVDNTQMEILKNRISLLERMFDSQKNEISQRCAQEVARVSDRMNIECARQIGVISDKYESEFDRQSGDLKSQYEVAYKNLRDDYDKFTDRLGNWLTVIGIFVALLGVGVPVIATFVQWKNIRDGIAAIEQGKEKELSILRKDSVKLLHMSLQQNVQSIDMGVKLSDLDMAAIICSLILCFDDLLECAMRTKDESVVKDEVAAFRPFLNRWTSSDVAEIVNIWAKCKTLLKSAMNNKKNSSRRKAFAELLGENSETFKWLEGFYRKFAEWKFA